MKLEVEVITQHLIKPSSPTPDQLRHYQLSFLDQIQVPIFMPLTLFYPEESSKAGNAADRCQCLKQSLSVALTTFYQLAGRARDNSYVDCNDEGVPFVEAQANCQLSNFLENPNPGDLNKLHPFELDDVRDLPAAAQFTVFECGGVAISFIMSHKLGDGLSCFMFLNFWASIARGDDDVTVPFFDSAKLFPPKDLAGFQTRTGIVKDNIVAKRFVFGASAIAAIRAKYAETTTNTEFERWPTRVEALSAFIWTRFMAACTQPQTDHGKSDKIYTVLHTVNLRPRMDPPLSEKYFGNISRLAISVPSMGAAKDDGCCRHGIVSQMRDAIRQVNADYVRQLRESDDHLIILKDLAVKFVKGEVVSFSFTSLCRFPIYEADFGWGKPVWVGSARLNFKNLVTFIDTKSGDGIEAWVNMKVEDMAEFEKDEELVACVTPISKQNF